MLNFRKTMKRLLFFLYFSVIVFNLYSEESVFIYDLKKDIILGSLSVGMFISPFFINDNPGDIPNNLNINDVNFFDRGLMFPYDNKLDAVSRIIVPGLIVASVISPLAGNIRENFDTWLTYGIMYAQTLAFTYGTSVLIKKTVDRYRPYIYFHEAVEDDYHRSFPSGTTSYAFSAATFFSVTFLSEYPDSFWRFPVFIGSYALAATAGATRILSGSHFLTDVLAGAAIGTFFGWLMPTLHRRNNEDNKISFHFTGNEAVISLKF